jgi:hypothetical protein
MREALVSIPAPKKKRQKKKKPLPLGGEHGSFEEGWAPTRGIKQFFNVTSPKVTRAMVLFCLFWMYRLFLCFNYLDGPTKWCCHI